MIIVLATAAKIRKTVRLLNPCSDYTTEERVQGDILNGHCTGNSVKSHKV